MGLKRWWRSRPNFLRVIIGLIIGLTTMFYFFKSLYLDLEFVIYDLMEGSKEFGLLTIDNYHYLFFVPLIFIAFLFIGYKISKIGGKFTRLEKIIIGLSISSIGFLHYLLNSLNYSFDLYSFLIDLVLFLPFFYASYYCSVNLDKIISKTKSKFMFLGSIFGFLISFYIFFLILASEGWVYLVLPHLWPFLAFCETGNCFFSEWFGVFYGNIFFAGIIGWIVGKIKSRKESAPSV